MTSQFPDHIERRPVSAAARILQGGPVALVTTSDRGKTNVLPIAWLTPLSGRPPLVGIALARERHSVELISHSEQFTLNFPSRALLHHVQYLGSVSGTQLDKLDATKLFNGLELQLLSYLGLLRQLTPSGGLPKLIPAGVFYVGLRGSEGTASTRNEALEAGEPERRLAFQHSGRINEAWAAHLDKAGLGEQFKTGPRSREMFPAAEFEQLIDDVENHLKKFGHRVLDGVVDIAPYRKGQETACSRCDFQALCRFDPWVEPFRSLKPLPKKTPATARATG